MPAARCGELRNKDYALAESSLRKPKTCSRNSLRPIPAKWALVLMEFGFLRCFKNATTKPRTFKLERLDPDALHLSADHPQMLTMKEEYASTLRKLKRKADAKRVEEELRIAAKLSPDDPGSKHRIDVSDLRGR